MEFPPCNSKMELLYGAALFILACAVASAEEASPYKNSQCHNYAGGHVYPGEAFRVPVSDHSLHLSKAKSEFLTPPSAGSKFTGALESAEFFFLVPCRWQLRFGACARRTIGTTCV